MPNLFPPKWIDELGDEAQGHVIIGDAESLRLAAGRHVERAERQIDEGKERDPRRKASDERREEPLGDVDARVHRLPALRGE